MNYLAKYTTHITSTVGVAVLAVYSILSSADAVSSSVTLPPPAITTSILSAVYPYELSYMKLTFNIPGSRPRTSLNMSIPTAAIGTDVPYIRIHSYDLYTGATFGNLTVYPGQAPASDGGFLDPVVTSYIGTNDIGSNTQFMFETAVYMPFDDEIFISYDIFIGTVKYGRCVTIFAFGVSFFNDISAIPEVHNYTSIQDSVEYTYGAMRLTNPYTRIASYDTTTKMNATFGALLIF